MLRAIEDGAWNASLRARLDELERRKAALTSRLAELAASPPAFRLHPNGAALYRAKVADLEASLVAPEVCVEATALLRNLIERVALIPGPEAPDGLQAELHGDLATILALAASPTTVPSQGAAARLPGRMSAGRRAALPGTSVPGSAAVVGCGGRI